MPEEEGWAVQGATGCFLKMEGISKSRLSPETIRRLPPLFYTKRDPARYSSGRAAQEPLWWDGPGQESIRGTHQACGCVPLRGFQRNVHKRFNGFLLLLNIPKSAAPCWKVYLVDSINETLFFFFFLNQYWATDVRRLDFDSTYCSTTHLERLPWGEPASWRQTASRSLKTSRYHSCSALHIS